MSNETKIEECCEKCLEFFNYGNCEHQKYIPTGEENIDHTSTKDVSVVHVEDWEKELKEVLIRHTRFFLKIEPTSDFIKVMMNDIETISNIQLLSKEKEVKEGLKREIEKMICEPRHPTMRALVRPTTKTRNKAFGDVLSLLSNNKEDK